MVLNYFCDAGLSCLSINYLYSQQDRKPHDAISRELRVREPQSNPSQCFCPQLLVLLPCAIQKHPMTTAALSPEKGVLTLTSSLVKMWNYTKPLFLHFDGESCL